MTPSLRTARTCTAAVILSAGLAIYGATISLWLLLPGLYVGAIAWWCADQAYTKHALAQRADVEPVPDPGPCCSFWEHSDGQVHGPGCKRPPLPRRDTYRLTPAERTAFDEITAHHNDRSAS